MAVRTVGHDRHHGPLRVLQALYPEGPAICHHVLVHPPGGIVGGDRLDIDIDLAAGAHAVLTTPGATRFYRSADQPAAQSTRLRLGPGARLEWLPLETLVHDGCHASNLLQMELEDGAAIIGWDILALGLPASGRPFQRGRFAQQIEWPQRWLESSRFDHDDPREAALTRRLLASPMGWAGCSVLATAWCARKGVPDDAGATWADRARQAIEQATYQHALQPHAWGVTSPQPGLTVARLLAPRTEALWPALQALRAAWRDALWGLPDHRPRVWRT